MRFVHTLALVQGLYFAATGVWPLVHVGSFMAVTGPKTDVWLVRTVGALVLVVGAAIAAAGWRGRVTGEVAFLAIGASLGLAAVDVIYVVRRVIARIYLADAAAELALVAAWAWVLLRFW